ncbi:2-oxo-4-hydroxy-4-carboxy-5-ureidoimidazoline decarboxylase [uncultured Paraglaciecola sp.]|uniref:2-oxo-4-hydroxy-4-carboxy-5-ureidoimidazoline decarboxylase n=1 Tax=uncultured Paraglaciecola sp. TaxID=1765024 RepID=UPI0030DA4273|tara:strand:- start:43120 stop:43659 length:540 start_codon:yes stop_codon:yes gene_type:complete
MNPQAVVSLDTINNLSPSEAQQWFSHCCAAPKWFQGMANARPFTDIEQLKQVAQTLWLECSEADFLIAFEAHPMIGDVNSLRAKYAATKNIASNEQNGATQASEETLQALAEANHQYLAKHGFIFIICATGLSADTMLNALMQRINNSTQQEIQLAAAEQIKITLLRLEKGLEKGIQTT